MGEVIAAAPELCGEPERLGNLYDYWLSQRGGLPASEMLRLLLRALGPIWPGRLSLNGVPLGDCGRHGAVPGDGIVPFHKLSQWLAYSLIEPLADAGFTITDIDGLTGLAEYRNGGLLIDCSAIVARDEELLRPLLDRLAARVRERLGVTAAEFPLSKVLEGGTWAAGREIAAERRPGGSAPI